MEKKKTRKMLTVLNRMSNNERKTSKLAITGLIVSAAIPGLFFLCVLVNRLPPLI